MSRLKDTITLSFGLLALVLLFGCDSSGRERVEDVMKLPAMKKALQVERSNEPLKAIPLYRQVCDAYPLETLPHLQLANLLFEEGEDYLAAIYHYKRFLSLVGEDNRRFTAVTDRIRLSEQKLAYRYAGTIAEGSANENVQLVQNITRQNKKISSLEDEKADLARSNSVLEAELRLSRARNMRLTLLVQKMQSGPVSGEVQASAPGRLSPHVISKDDGTKQVIQTYEVKKGDNLSRIAEECYGDPNGWKRIIEANPDKIERSDRVRPGVILIIPPL